MNLPAIWTLRLPLKNAGTNPVLTSVSPPEINAFAWLKTL